MQRLALLLFLIGTTTLAAIAPANPNTTPPARALLNYLSDLQARADRKILSGQFMNFGNGASLRLMQQVQEKTGRWPAIIGVDYADFGKGSITTKIPNQTALEYWKQGGIVTISAHLYNPANPAGGGLRDKGVDLKTLLDDQSETHARWMTQLDLIADGLAELQQAGVPVLWRPFHEMNGGWFWWGAKEPADFIAVWKHMFKYFTDEKKLNNLLWVYSPNHGQRTAAYYAGDTFVDVIGLDAYSDFIDLDHIKGFPEIVKLPKPFGFTEFGPHGSQNPPGDYDYLRFLDGIKKNFPQTVFFMSWSAKWSLATNLNSKEFLSDPLIVNRENLPDSLRAQMK